MQGCWFQQPFFKHRPVRGKYMLYRKYELYEDAVDIMIPDNLTQTQDMFRDYMWVSDDKKIVITLTQSLNGMNEKQLLMRLQDYYLEYQSAVKGFQCKYIKKHEIHRKEFGLMHYESEVMGYTIQNMVLLGVFEKQELVLTLQCGETNQEEQLHIFSNVIESLNIKERKEKKDED